jgi:hypothetical protein
MRPLLDWSMARDKVLQARDRSSACLLCEKLLAAVYRRHARGAQ